ncbi:PH domain-containing protein [Streptomyces sp. NPDC021100]|uniref:PH domain-containing protein n=1 Tax=Streptomyces sp. NPDC021100 TaxID=3365114 RepID=UPI0037AB5DF4
MNRPSLCEPRTGRPADHGQTPVEWRRLSPRMLLVHPLREAVRLLPPLAVVVLLGRNPPQLWGLIGLVAAVGIGAARWAGTSYRLTGDQILLRRGLLRRELLTVPRDRVRSVDAVSGPYQRILGLQRLVVGTGRSGRHGDELVLDALDATVAERLRDELLRRAPRDPLAQAAHRPPSRTEAVADHGEIAAFRPGWIRFGAVTLTGPAGLGVLLMSFTTFLDEEKLGPDRIPGLSALARRLGELPAGLSAAVVVVLALLAASALSAVRYAFSFRNFRLARSADGTLRTRHGLTTVRSVTLEEHRIGGVEISETLPLRLLGGARCTAVTTGPRAGRAPGSGGALLLPPASLAEARRVAAAVSGAPSAVDCPLTAHGTRSARRLLRRARAGAAAVVALVWTVTAWTDGPWWTELPHGSRVAVLLLPPAAELLARDRYRNLGHALHAGRLVIRRGSLVRRRQVLREDAVTGWIFHASFFQRRAGLTTLTAATAAGRQYYNVPDVPVEAAVPLADAARPGWLEPFLVAGPPAHRG